MTDNAREIHVRSFGQGPRQALAIHCTLGHAGNWRGLGRELSDDLTLAAFDLPGHGRSGDWNAEADYQDVSLDWALAVLPPAPVDLIGHSFGATVALRIAINFPERVRTLTLIEPVLFAAARTDAPAAMAQHLEESRPYLEAMRAEDWPRAARRFNRLWGYGTKWDDFPQTARDYMTRRVRFVAAQSAAIFDDRAHLLAAGQIERAEMPVLLLEGSESLPIISAIHDALEARLPDVRRTKVEGAGHMAPVSHAGDVAAAIRSLLEMA